jgi:hypothetical protein
MARSHIACVALAGFGNGDGLAVSLSLQMLSLLTGTADSSLGALKHLGFGFRQVRHSFTLAGIRPA